jgi:CubicO group peptidase (beta-lactamase class C family)
MHGLRFAVFSLCFAACGWSQATKGPSAPAQAADARPTPGAATGHALDAADLEGFFDGILPMQLERSDIAGASVLVMQDGKVLLQKGYGVADEKSQKPVDPVSTIFRLASISKLFTWTSVMQLQEQGKLDIDADVNQYLDFQIRPAFGKPITLRNLMTHMGGFEEENRDVILTDPKQAVTLRDFLIRNQPVRMYAPGTVPAYSNYGVGLAGYIVQRVSGEPYEQYVAEHIFDPLGMVHSTFSQPPPKALEKLPSEGYRGDTTKPPVGFEIFNPAPAGGISSTAADMGRFGQMLLNGGELDGKRILKPETLALMWTPQYQASPQLPPICMGFYQSWRDGVHWIGHQGDLIAFHSLFFVEPVHKLTLFVSYNSAGGSGRPRPEIIDMFTDRYFPSEAKPAFLSLSRDELKQIEGTYQPTRRSDSTIERFTSLAAQATASIDKDGALHALGAQDLRGHPVKFKPIAKDLWQEVDGQRRLFAIRDSNGNIARVAGDFPGSQEERVPWYANGKLVLPLFGGSLAVLLAVLIAPLWRMVHRILLRRRPRPAPQPGTRWLPGMTKFAAMLWVLPLAILLPLAARAGDDLMPPTDAWDKWFMLKNLVIGVALLVSLSPMRSALRIWPTDLRWITKIKFSLVGLSFVVLAWVSVFFHLIGTVRI